MKIEDIATEYAPYHEMEAFWKGVRDYQARAICSMELGVYAQAYDRGAECAMRVQQHNEI